MKTAVILAIVAYASAATLKTARQAPGGEQWIVESGNGFFPSVGSPFGPFGGEMGMPFGSPFDLFGGFMMPVITFIPIPSFPFGMMGMGPWGGAPGPNTGYPPAVFPTEETTTTTAAPPATTEEELFTTVEPEYTTDEPSTTTEESWTTTIEPFETSTTTFAPSSAEPEEVCEPATSADAQGTFDQAMSKLSCHARSFDRRIKFINEKRLELIHLAELNNNKGLDFIAPRGTRNRNYVNELNSSIYKIGTGISSAYCSITPNSVGSKYPYYQDFDKYFGEAGEGVGDIYSAFANNPSPIPAYQSIFDAITREAAIAYNIVYDSLIPLSEVAVKVSDYTYLDVVVGLYNAVGEECDIVPNYWELVNQETTQVAAAGK